jgi:hypothetical protein
VCRSVSEKESVWQRVSKRLATEYKGKVRRKGRALSVRGRRETILSCTGHGQHGTEAGQEEKQTGLDVYQWQW